MSMLIPNGYCVLADAIDHVGRVIFPHNWTGNEIELLPELRPSSLPDQGGKGTASGRLHQAIDQLRDWLANGSVPSSVFLVNGTLEPLAGAIWFTDDAVKIFRSGNVAAIYGLKAQLAAKKGGKSPRAVVVPIAALNKALSHRSASMGAESECRTMIRELVSKGTSAKKADVWAEAHERFGVRLSERSFNRAWDAEAPASWKKSGRRKSPQ
jgi:hypothetical protein